MEKINDGDFLFEDKNISQSNALLKFGYQKLFSNLLKNEISGVIYLLHFSSHSQAKKTLDSLNTTMNSVLAKK